MLRCCRRLRLGLVRKSALKALPQASRPRESYLGKPARRENAVACEDRPHDHVSVRSNLPEESVEIGRVPAAMKQACRTDWDQDGGTDDLAVPEDESVQRECRHRQFRQPNGVAAELPVASWWRRGHPTDTIRLRTASLLGLGLKDEMSHPLRTLWTCSSRRRAPCVGPGGRRRASGAPRTCATLPPCRRPTGWTAAPPCWTTTGPAGNWLPA